MRLHVSAVVDDGSFLLTRCLDRSVIVQPCRLTATGFIVRRAYAHALSALWYRHRRPSPLSALLPKPGPGQPASYSALGARGRGIPAADRVHAAVQVAPGRLWLLPAVINFPTPTWRSSRASRQGRPRFARPVRCRRLPPSSKSWPPRYPWRTKGVG